MKNCISRRSFLKAAGILGAAGALAACGGSSSGSTAASSTASSAAASAASEAGFTFKPGTYTAKAHLGNNPDAAWEEPYYEGTSESFTIVKDKITEAQTIVCKMANVRVTIIFSEELKEHMADDAKVNVVMGDDATLSFAKTETRSGYFAYLEGSNTLAATFDGSVDGVHETSSRVHTDVAPGTHYRITYKLHSPGTDPNASGATTSSSSTA